MYHNICLSIQFLCLFDFKQLAMLTHHTTQTNSNISFHVSGKGRKYSILTLVFMFFTLIFGDNFLITNFSKLCSR